MNLTSVDKVAIIGDIHNGVHSDSTLWHKIGKEWSIWFKSQLDSRGITTVLFLGDYFHNRSDVSVSTLQAAADMLSQWKDINFVFVIGNHDCQNKHNTEVNSIAIFQGWSNIHVIKGAETLNIGGTSCSFASWGSTVESLDKSDYLFGHFEISTFKMNNYKICEKGVNPRDLFKVAPIVFSGHFHHRDERLYGGKSITYVGNPFEMDFGDIDNVKGFYILDLKNRTTDFIENDKSPRHLKIKISSYDENIDITNRIVKLIIDQKIPVDQVDKFIASLSVKSPLQLSVEYTYNNEIELVDIKDCDLSGIDRGKAIEDFIQLLDIDNKTDLNKLCQDIYSTL